MIHYLYCSCASVNCLLIISAAKKRESLKSEVEAENSKTEENPEKNPPNSSSENPSATDSNSESE